MRGWKRGESSLSTTALTVGFVDGIVVWQVGYYYNVWRADLIADVGRWKTHMEGATSSRAGKACEPLSLSHLDWSESLRAQCKKPSAPSLRALTVSGAVYVCMARRLCREAHRGGGAGGAGGGGAVRAAAGGARAGGGAQGATAEPALGARPSLQGSCGLSADDMPPGIDRWHSEATRGLPSRSACQHPARVSPSLSFATHTPPVPPGVVIRPSLRRATPAGASRPTC